MIGRITGKLILKKPPLLMLETNGIGYEVYAPMSTFYNLPELNTTTCLLTHFVVREDAQLLYGFLQERERELFRALIKVNGVGPKLALTVLSGIEPDVFVQCVQNNDASRLTGIPGIGKKTAERLVIETRDTLTKWETSTTSGISPEISATDQTQQDAISALISLGYKPVQAKRAIGLTFKPHLSSEELIRIALRQMLQGV